MIAKFLFLTVALFLVVQSSSAHTVVRRDVEAPPANKAPDTIDGIIDNVKKFFTENVKIDDIQNNLKQFGDKVQAGAKDFSNTVQQKASEIFKKDEVKA